MDRFKYLILPINIFSFLYISGIYTSSGIPSKISYYVMLYTSTH